MKDILKEIYEGDIHLEEMMVPTTEEYLKQKALVRELEEAFYEVLPTELKDDFARIVEERIRLAGIQVEEACMDGMRVGGQIAVALLKNPKTGSDSKICEFEP